MAINTKIKQLYNCFDGLVGIRDCGQEYSFYLDDYGFSLSKASNIADSSFLTARNLVNTIISQAIESTVKDIHFKGLQANKVLCELDFSVSDTDQTINTNQSITLTLQDHLKLGSFYISDLGLNVKTAGHIKLTITQNGTTTTLYDEDVTAGEIVVSMNQYVTDVFTLSLELTDGCEVYGTKSGDTCGCSCNKYFTTEDEVNNGISISLQVRCNKAKYLCKFKDLIAEAIIYKALGKLYYQVYNTDAFNNWVNSTKEESLTKAIYYDNGYINLVNTERNPNEKFGQYQLELESISKQIPQPKCSHCLECDSLGWSEVTVIP